MTPTTPDRGTDPSTPAPATGRVDDEGIDRPDNRAPGGTVDPDRARRAFDPAILAGIGQAVAEADLRVLLLCLFQLTGDHRWLEPPYRPVRDVRLIADEGAGLPADVAADIRDAATSILADGVAQGFHPALATPDDDVLLEMMSVCLDEDIDPAYVPMMREQLGFAPAEVPAPADDDVRRRLVSTDVVIVGAGVSGLALGAQLTRLGVPYTVVEKNSGVGGVWFENRYPGCGVDTPNHSYAYSFGRPQAWTHYFSPQEEIRAYLERCADEFGVRDHLRLSTTVISATWDDATARWTVELETPDGPETVTAAVFVSAIGQMNLPRVPDVEGRASFAGRQFHSARWPDDLDCTGLRVAVVGTGASSMQLVPTIADDVAELTVYQRSAQWMRPIPRYTEQVGAGTQWLLDHVPFYATWYRFTLLWRYGDGLLPFLEVDPDWEHPDRSINKGNDRHRAELTDHVERSLAGRPDLLDKCLPTYPPYGKRMLIDNGWFETLRRDHVELVTDDLDTVDADGITAGGIHRDHDVIVWATGFRVTDLTARLDVTGRDGHTLAEEWAGDDPKAHLGITVPGFPNLFCLYGPNTNLGHGGSIVFHAECQATYITDALAQMAERDVAAVEPTRAAHDAWIAGVDARHERMIWTHPGMSTWYRNDRGRVVSVSPYRLVDYWAMTRHADLDDFHLQERP